ncbi:MAG: hypothetical protein M1269_07115 [Chloroflexi bacterium]|nr:hypothetical protein [Chloroflexota bacterium]
MSLTENQKKQIKKYLGKYNRYLKSAQSKKDLEERAEKEKYFRSIDRRWLENLDENKVEELIRILWASLIWGDKRYLTTKIIADNGLDKLRTELIQLFYGKEPPEKRYERFLKNVSMRPTGSVTEILCFHEPGKCGIWNDKARKALGLLDFSETLPLNKYKISAQEYSRFNQAIKEIADEVKKPGGKNMNLLDVDYFLWKVWDEGSIEDTPVIEGKEESFDHDEIRDHIWRIGGWLGFDAETEKQVAYGAKVDVLWHASIGKLGVVKYVFEVQKGGSIDSLILNLQKAKNNPTVQRVVAVSDQKQLDKIQKEAEGIRDLKEHLAFWPVSDVEKVYERLAEVEELMKRLELVKDEFTRREG